MLADEAAAADARADWLNGHLLRGDNLDSQALAQLASQLEPLPEAAENRRCVISSMSVSSKKAMYFFGLAAVVSGGPIQATRTEPTQRRAKAP